MDVIDSSHQNSKNIHTQYLPLVLLVVFVALFFSTFEGLFQRWIKWDQSLSHGLLVCAVFIYFLYKSLPWQTQHNRQSTHILLCSGLALMSLAWYASQLANIYIFEQLLVLLLLAGLYACGFGWQLVVKYRLLFLLPIFTITIWDQLTEPLVNLSGFAVGKMVQLIDMPANIQGNSIFIPYGHIVIADGCSGLRYFEIALTLAYIISLLNNYNEKQFIPTLIIAAALGLVANWLRIFILVIIGYKTQMQSPMMSDHEYFGWALFACLCLPAIYFAPVVKSSAGNTITDPNAKPRLTLPLIALAIGPLLSVLIKAEPKPTPIKAVINPAYKAFLFEPMPTQVTAPEHGEKERGLVSTPQGDLHVQVDHYQRLNKTDKLVPYINRLYSNEEWLAQSSKVEVLNHSATLTRFRRKNSQVEVMQLQWLEVGEHITSSLAIAKLLQIPVLVSGPNAFKIITLQAQCERENCENAKKLVTGDIANIFVN